MSVFTEGIPLRVSTPVLLKKSRISSPFRSISALVAFRVGCHHRMRVSFVPFSGLKDGNGSSVGGPPFDQQVSSRYRDGPERAIGQYFIKRATMPGRVNRVIHNKTYRLFR